MIVRHVATFVILLLPTFLASQSLELSGGKVWNKYWELKLAEDDRGSYTSYNMRDGEFIGLTLDDVFKDSWPMRFGIGLDKSSTRAYSRVNQNAGSTAYDLNIERTTFHLRAEIYNLKAGNFYFNFVGFDLSFLLNEKTTGTYDPTISNQEVYLDTANLTRFFTFGITNRMAYEFNLGNKWKVLAFYKFYFAFGKEFNIDYYFNPNVFRHYLGLGVKRNLYKIEDN